MTEEIAVDPADNGIAADPFAAEAPEAKSEEAPADPGEKESEKESGKEQGKEKYVPHAAFHEERERRKELQQQLRARDEAQARLSERLDRLNEVILAPRQELQDADPLEIMAREVLELKKSREDERQQALKEAETRKSQTEFYNRYAASAESFAKDQPDFKPAYDFLLNSRAEELRMMGIPQAEIGRALANDEYYIVQNAYQSEKNPAQVLYELAKARGYKSEQGASRLERLDKGLKAKSLGSGGGKPDGGGFDIANLATMSDEEFEQTWKQFEKQAKR